MEPWLRMLSPNLNLRLPASGDVAMDYNPWTNWGLASGSAGNPRIETEVFRDVALPGKQLGKLTDAVRALTAIVEAEHKDVLARHPEQARAIRELATMADDIERKKDQIKTTAKADALAALERLKEEDASGFAALVEDLLKQKAAQESGEGIS